MMVSIFWPAASVLVCFGDAVSASTRTPINFSFVWVFLFSCGATPATPPDPAAVRTYTTCVYTPDPTLPDLNTLRHIAPHHSTTYFPRPGHEHQERAKQVEEVGGGEDGHAG